MIYEHVATHTVSQILGRLPMAVCPINFPQDIDAQTHYAGSRSEEHGEDMACFHLLRVSDQRIDGFIALKASHHTDAERDIGELNVAYVFVVPAARRQRLSSLLAEAAIEHLLVRFEGCETLGQLELRSSSEPITKEGAEFIRRMEYELAEQCTSNGWSFSESPYSQDRQSG